MPDHPPAPPTPHSSPARRFPLLGKCLALGAVLIALTLALEMVTGIVAERQGRQDEAQRSVADSLASAQVLAGPVLQRRCVETWTVPGADGSPRTERRELVLSATPAALQLKARATIEPRHRGIFTVNGYVLKAQAEAEWAPGIALQPRAEHAGSALRCDAPLLAVSVTDVRGLRHAAIQVDGRSLPARPGTAAPERPRGFHALLTDERIASPTPLRASLSFELVGTSSLGIVPAGETTRVELASDWPHPSFNGRFLPSERQVGDHGFNAVWQLSALATSAPAELRAGGVPCGTTAEARCVETFGVDFIDPVSGYVLSDRATKYGLLFIVLTFVGVGLVEVMRRLRVHPIQYLLVGSAIAVFFLLLVSLTEHLAFDLAYLAASTACTLLLGFYGRFVLHGWRGGLGLGLGTAALYSALYTLLQLEQGALVLGSVLLFAVLATVMVATRHVDWYALFDDWRGEPARRRVQQPQ